MHRFLVAKPSTLAYHVRREMERAPNFQLLLLHRRQFPFTGVVAFLTMTWSETSLILLAACVVPMVIGVFSGSPTKAALGAAVLMSLLTFVARAGLGYADKLHMPSFAETAILSLAIIPGMMVFGLIGYGVRCALRRLLTPKSTL